MAGISRSFVWSIGQRIRRLVENPTPQDQGKLRQVNVLKVVQPLLGERRMERGVRRPALSPPILEVISVKLQIGRPVAQPIFERFAELQGCRDQLKMAGTCRGRRYESR